MSTYTNQQLSEGAAGPGALSIAARDKIRSQSLKFSSTRTTGGSSRTDVLGICQQAGTLRAAWCMTDEALSAGESIQFDIIDRGTGLTVLTAPVTVTTNQAKEVQLALPLDPAKVTRGIGDSFNVVRTYVPGGSPNDPVSIVVLEWD